MLWAGGICFAQVIEGGSEQVDSTMNRIRADRLHSVLEALLNRPVSSRQFGNWSMRKAGDDDASASGTGFMIGYAMGERTRPARRLYEIVMPSDAGNGAWSTQLSLVWGLHTFLE